MILKQLRVNSGTICELTNCYIIQDENTKDAMVIDPGGEPEKIIEMLNILQANLKYIYITHCHGDHIGALIELKNKKGGKILIHRIEKEGLHNKNISLTDYVGVENIELDPDSIVDDEDLIHVGNIEFKIIHTPGHTSGSSSLYCEKEKLLFSGDTMFYGTWGRTDLPTSNFHDIINSISEKLLKLPDDTIVYPRTRKTYNN